MSKPEVRVNDWVRGITMAAVVASAAGCNVTMSIEERGHALVSSEPTEGAVHPYPWHHPPPPLAGPFLAVFLSSRADLERLSERSTHHLYFELVPCSQTSHGFDLMSGTVFRATEAEHARMLAPTENELYLYKVHIPTDVHKLVAQTSVQGALDVAAYVGEAGRDGVCIRLGGGQMWGTSSLSSNLVRAPIKLQDNELVVDDHAGKED